MSDLREKELKDGDDVPYICIDKNYGRAEFQFCVQWKRGKIQRVFIYPKQQRRVENYYRVECGFSDSFQFQSWTHKGIEEPWAWHYGWCKEHQCQMVTVYVPNDTSKLTINRLSSLQFIFE